MADLERFRAKVKEYRLLVNRNQGDLASYLNLDYTELSNRLNASKKAYLTHENTRAIVRALADWGAIATRAQAAELLDLLACPYFDEVDWQARPLSKLSSITANGFRVACCGVIEAALARRAASIPAERVSVVESVAGGD